MRRSRLEAEIGRIDFAPLGQLAASLGPKEMVTSARMEELQIMFATKGGDSYRFATTALNRTLHREGADCISLRTYTDTVNRYGREYSELEDQTVRNTLEAAGFSPVTGKPTEEAIKEGKLPKMDEDDGTGRKEKYGALIDRFNEKLPEEVRIKDEKLISQIELDPERAVYIKPDEIGVEHQAEHRRARYTKSSRYVENTVITITTGKREYIITGTNMRDACKAVLAFLIRGKLLDGRPLIFFSDGARNICSALMSLFSFYGYKLYLDWYHLTKRIREILSMAVKAKKEERHAILDRINGRLWAGNLDEAITCISSIDEDKVRSKKKLKEAVDYLRTKAPYIYCYALRAKAGLTNSSSAVEKANDLVVAQRQKHNGMSWSYDGSAHLATLTAAARNGELPGWIRNRQLSFAFRKGA